MIDSILWEGVEVGAGATVERCILADGVVVGAGARAEGVVAGKGSRIGTGGGCAARYVDGSGRQV
ncbi:MAG: hypothetical protein M5U18_06185 [Dehalococcoidia bacterium]|nr:hypothetical protein [Dehalococcoidia bacterium]